MNVLKLLASGIGKALQRRKKAKNATVVAYPILFPKLFLDQYSASRLSGQETLNILPTMKNNLSKTQRQLLDEIENAYRAPDGFLYGLAKGRFTRRKARYFLTVLEAINTRSGPVISSRMVRLLWELSSHITANECFVLANNGNKKAFNVFGIRVYLAVQFLLGEVELNWSDYR